jgi:hypothetical protein
MKPVITINYLGSNINFSTTTPSTSGSTLQPSTGGITFPKVNILNLGWVMNFQYSKPGLSTLTGQWDCPTMFLFNWDGNVSSSGPFGVQGPSGNYDAGLYLDLVVVGSTNCWGMWIFGRNNISLGFRNGPPIDFLKHSLNFQLSGATLPLPSSTVVTATVDGAFTLAVNGASTTGIALSGLWAHPNNGGFSTTVAVS